jgi:cell division protein ZapA
MRQKFGQVGDDRLILMASLVVADELWELRRQIQETKVAVAEANRGKSAADQTVKAMQVELAARVSAVADRLDGLNTRLVQDEPSDA